MRKVSDFAFGILVLLLVSTASNATASNDEWTIPFEMNRNHIVLPVKIKGKEFRIALDNGSLPTETILYGGPEVDKLALPYSGKILVGGGGDENMPSADMAHGITLSIGGLKIADQPLIVMPYDPVLKEAFRGEDGVMGGVLFNHFVVKLDFIKKEVTLIQPDKFEYKGKGQKLHIHRSRNGGSALICSLELEDGTALALQLHMDLGSPHELSLNTASRPDIKIPEKTTKLLGVGSQGRFTEYKGRVKTFSLGKYTFKNLPAAFTPSKNLAMMEGVGSIGNTLFQRFDVTFDYKNDRLFLEPNSRFDGSIESKPPEEK